MIPTSSQGTRAPVQYAYLVPDLDSGMALARKHWALGPFFVIPDIQVEDARYRGQASELVFSVALAQAADIQIELIVQHSAAASAFTDMQDGRPCRLHHAAIMVDDFDAAVAAYAADGFEIANSGRAFGVMPFCYVDTCSELGHMIEIVPRSDALLDIYARVRSAALDWNGEDPVRHL